MLANKRGQSGNVFFIILIAVMLFAALSFTFSKGLRQGGESIGRRQAELAASDIMTYAQKVDRGVQLILSRRISENELSFENDSVTGYANADCADDRCKIFNPQGGGVTWQNPPARVNNGEPFLFVTNRVGSVTDGIKQVGTTERDLVIMLPVKPIVCDMINKRTGVAETWESTGSPNVSTPFAGNFTTAPGTRIANGDSPEQPSTGCFCDGTDPCSSTDPHYFYSVILQR